MARIFTTPESERTAQSFLNDILFAAGIRSSSRRQGTTYSFSADHVVAAKEVCDELINRDFKLIDNYIHILSRVPFLSTLDGGDWRRLKPEVVAKAIVYMAELIGLYWDDTIRTPFEVDEFKKTLLGTAVYKYGRYISAIKDPKTAKNRATSSGSSTTKTARSAPQNGYKQSGPQSGNVRDLRGNPGDKVTADTSFIYKIIADKVGKNTPNVFIKPLSASGEVNGTNKIFISSGNGYTDCTCYFDDPNDAQVFLDKIIQNNRVPSNIVNIRVAKMSADPNGYFLVGTEFGVVAVSAKTLNEALTEETATSEIKEAKEEAKEKELTGWEKATKNYSKEELDELHTWMRRD